jgi:PAS domain-containing protein
VSERPPQRNLILILARDFASRLATPVFLVDAEGTVVYFNEAAERLLGLRFVEGRGMTSQDWAALFSPADEAGAPLRVRETPLGVAFQEHRPEHATLTIRDADGTETEERVDACFVFIGAAPRTDWLDGVVERDEHGFILAGQDVPRERWPLKRDPYVLETTVPGVFVAGDVRARSIKRVASAVGEGSMAVSLIHQYLAEA